MKTLLLGLVLLSACGGSYRAVRPDDGPAVFPPRVVVLDGTHTPDEVRVAVSAGLRDRDFAISADAPQRVAATLTSRRILLSLDVAYSPTRVDISYTNASGEIITDDGRSPFWEKQTRALESSIIDALKKPKPAPVVVAPEPKAPKAKRPAPFVAMFHHRLEWEAARAAVRDGLAKHNWVVEDEGMFGSWVVRLDHGDEQIRCELSLANDSAELKYKNSVGLDFDAQGRNKTYERWLRNVVTAIEDVSRNR